MTESSWGGQDEEFLCLKVHESQKVMFGKSQEGNLLLLASSDLIRGLDFNKVVDSFAQKLTLIFWKCEECHMQIYPFYLFPASCFISKYWKSLYINFHDIVAVSFPPSRNTSSLLQRDKVCKDAMVVMVFFTWEGVLVSSIFSWDFSLANRAASLNSANLSAN